MKIAEPIKLKKLTVFKGADEKTLAYAKWKEKANNLVAAASEVAVKFPDNYTPYEKALDSGDFRGYFIVANFDAAVGYLRGMKQYDTAFSAYEHNMQEDIRMARTLLKAEINDFVTAQDKKPAQERENPLTHEF